MTAFDRESAATAFGAFQAGKTLTSTQLRFLNEVVDYLARNGTINVDALYRSPFNAIAPRGPEDIFADSEIDAMVSTMNAVNATATPA